jgi:hypothetical protein
MCSGREAGINIDELFGRWRIDVNRRPHTVSKTDTCKIHVISPLQLMRIYYPKILDGCLIIPRDARAFIRCRYSAKGKTPNGHFGNEPGSEKDWANSPSTFDRQIATPSLVSKTSAAQ